MAWEEGEAVSENPSNHHQPVVTSLVADARDQLAQAGVEVPLLEAELLLAAALGISRSELYLQPDRRLTTADTARFGLYLEKRRSRIPIQYIMGKAAFRHLNLYVDPAVLIPRPETEILVDVALELGSYRHGFHVLELGCGSGAISLSLVFESTATRVVATDISVAAIRTARRNALHYDPGSRIRFVCGDLLAPLRGAACFDLVVSNPPYVPSGALPFLDPEVRDYEPRQALDGGGDGLAFYRRMACDAVGLLASGGHLVVEVGDGQADSVVEILQQSGDYIQVAVRDDLNGISRVVSAMVPQD